MLFCFSPLFLKNLLHEDYMNQTQVQPAVSVLRDMGHVVWSGCRLCPGVDISFWAEKLPGIKSHRHIRARLVRPEETPVVADWFSQQHFDLAMLGRDYLNLETEVMEMMVIARHVTNLAIVPDEEGPGVSLILTLPGSEQRFRLNVGIVGRWDWFINPREMVPNPIQLAEESATA